MMQQNQHIISLSEAETMTHAYQADPQFQGLTIASCIDKNAYTEVINQPECERLRTYFALNEQGNLTIVVVGVDANGNDLTNGILLNKGYDCPSNCPTNSSLIG
jgi:hypothetical protein